MDWAFHSPKSGGQIRRTRFYMIVDSRLWQWISMFAVGTFCSGLVVGDVSPTRRVWLSEGELNAEEGSVVYELFESTYWDLYVCKFRPTVLILSIDLRPYIDSFDHIVKRFSFSADSSTRLASVSYPSRTHLYVCSFGITLTNVVDRKHEFILGIIWRALFWTALWDHLFLLNTSISH